MKKVQFLSLLRNRDYVLFIFGLFISNIGTFMQAVAVNWQLYLLTKSPISLGLLGLAKFVPVLIFSSLSGIVADIFDRKKILFLVQIFSILNSLTLAFFTVTGKITPTLIYIFVGLEAGIFSFDAPARQSMTPNLVGKEEFPLAININNIFFNTTNFIGPAIAGFVIAFSGVKTVYLINAASFLAVILALILMKPLKPLLQKPEFTVKSIKEGIDFVFKMPVIYGSMFIDFFATFFASAMTLMPIFAVSILKTGPKEMGLLYAAPAVGALIGGLIFPLYSHIRPKGQMLVYSVIVFGAAIFLFAFSRNFYLSLILIAISGVGDMISVQIRNVIRQVNTPNHMRGRMTAINMIFYTGGPQLGEMEAGFAAGLMGTPLSVAFGGLATVFATVIIAKKIPSLLNYKDVD